MIQRAQRSAIFHTLNLIWPSRQLSRSVSSVHSANILQAILSYRLASAGQYTVSSGRGSPQSTPQ
eukprot:1629-Heterococcus_DN1.PRE.3